jgi:hypothetical protein
MHYICNIWARRRPPVSDSEVARVTGRSETMVRHPRIQFTNSLGKLGTACVRRLRPLYPDYMLNGR